MLECLKTVVGLSQDACACFDTDRPGDYNTSKSGLFIADKFPLEFANSAADCEKGGLWTLMENARVEAVKHFLGDYAKNVLFAKSFRFKPFDGLIGSQQFSLALSAQGSTLGIRHEVKRIIGGCHIITGVSLALNGIAPATDVTVEVYSSLDLVTPIDSVVVSLATAGTFYSANFTSPLVLDLSSREEDFEYYFVYQLPVGASPVNNKVKQGCGCGGRHADLKRNLFLAYGAFKGIQVNAVTDLDEALQTSDFANGLRLNSTLSCNHLTWLCDLTYTADDIAVNKSSGQNIHMGMLVADLILAKSVAVLASKIANSGNVNRYTMLSKEHVWGLRSRFDKVYRDGLIFLVNNIPEDVTDCLMCKRDKNLSINNISV